MTINLLSISDKKIGIVGLGRTGISVFNATYGIASEILCYDDKVGKIDLIKYQEILDNSNLVQIIDKSISDYKKNIEWTKLDLLIVSPGIKPDHDIFIFAKKYNIEILSDIELFFSAIRYKDKKSIIVTGTNGKTTTTSMIAHSLNENSTKNSINQYVTGGNIGTPLLSLSDESSGYVIELSSFQLSNLKKHDYYFADIAVLLNITPDHLDYHKDLDEYIDAKAKIFDISNKKILCITNEHTYKLYERIVKNRVNSSNLNFVICCHEDIISKYHIAKDKIDYLFTYNAIINNGVTNIKLNIENHKNEIHSLNLECNLFQCGSLENIISVIAVNYLLGNDLNLIEDSINKFQPMKHRLQFIKDVKIKNIGSTNISMGLVEKNLIEKKIAFYNDSKATNVSAACNALNMFKNIFWLVGGIFKENDIYISDQLRTNIRKMYIYGSSKLIFTDYCDKFGISYSIYDDLESAVNAAYDDAKNLKILKSEDLTILLSPACASYDQFISYEDRGDQFIKMVNSL